MRKSSRVVFISDELEQAYSALPPHDPLKKALGRAIEALGANAFCGTQIPKRLFPTEYVRDYGIANLWKYDLPSGWRLLYTVAADEVGIISAILSWSDYKTYARRFRYRER